MTWVSLIGLIMTASVLFRHLRLSFRAIWKHAPPLVSGPVRVVMRATFREQAIAYAMVLSGGALLLVAVVLIGVIQWMSGLFNEAGPLNLTTTKWLLGLPSSTHSGGPDLRAPLQNPPAGSSRVASRLARRNTVRRRLVRRRRGLDALRTVLRQ